MKYGQGPQNSVELSGEGEKAQLDATVILSPLRTVEGLNQICSFNC